MSISLLCSLLPLSIIRLLPPLTVSLAPPFQAPIQGYQFVPQTGCVHFPSLPLPEILFPINFLPTLLPFLASHEVQTPEKLFEITDAHRSVLVHSGKKMQQLIALGFEPVIT